MALIKSYEVEYLMRQGAWASVRHRSGGFQRGYRTSSYSEVVSDAKLAYGYTPETLQRLPPSMAEIYLMDETSKWLGWIEINEVRQIVARRIVWNEDLGRCVHSYASIADEFELSVAQVKRRYEGGILQITSGVNLNFQLLNKIGLYICGLEAPYT